MGRPFHLAKPQEGAYSRIVMVGPYYMDAVITPHRSLSSRGVIVLIGVVTGINALTALVFVILGAGPVLAFLGLDVVAVVIAMAASNRAARREEQIQVTAHEVRVVLRGARGAQTVWVSPTALTRVALVGDPDDAVDLHLRLSDRGLAVARALSHPERLAFARALDRAVWRARRGEAIV